MEMERTNGTFYLAYLVAAKRSTYIAILLFSFLHRIYRYLVYLV